MPLPTEPYVEQTKRWPSEGRHILAHFDDRSIIVYQAYRPSIGRFAIEHGCFGGDFSFRRMSWIKPNFLWMMYRSGWGTREGQEITLGLRLRREFFDSILAQAVQSSYYEGHYPSREEWQDALTTSAVRLQWDPDHGPSGGKLERRALQLGLRGEVLEAFAARHGVPSLHVASTLRGEAFGKRELLEVIDMTEFVAEQRAHALLGTAELRTPVERVYTPSDAAVAKRIGLAGCRRNQNGGCYDRRASCHLRRVWLLAAERSARVMVGFRWLVGTLPLWPGDEDHRNAIARPPRT